MCQILRTRVLAPLAVTLTAQPVGVTVLERTYPNATASGGLPDWTYAWSSLPPGCRSQNVSRLLCIPTAPGTYVVRVTVTDSLGDTNSTTVTLRVSPSPAPLGLTTLVWVLMAAVVLAGVGLAVLAYVVWRMRRRPPGRTQLLTVPAGGRGRRRYTRPPEPGAAARKTRATRRAVPEGERGATGFRSPREGTADQATSFAFTR